LNSNEMAWNAALHEARTASSARSTYLAQCAGCHGDNLAGAPPQIPALTGLSSAQKVAAVIREGGGRMPAFPNLTTSDISALTDYLLSGQNKELSSTTATARYRFGGYHRFVDPQGYPAIAPPWGTLNAINLNTGEYAWKIPLGEYPNLAQKDTGSENYG